MRTALLTGEAIAWSLAAPEAFALTAATSDELIAGFRHRAERLGFQPREGDLFAGGIPRATDWQPAHLIPHARRILHPAGSIATLHLDPDDPGREILTWRWYSLCLPPLLWIAAATDSGLPARAGISLLHRSLAPQHPVAHQHLHAGAVFPFELLWSRLASKLDVTRLGKDGQAPNLGSPAAPLRRWLVRAMVARRWLAWRLLRIPLLNPGDRDIPRSLRDRALYELETGQLCPVSVEDPSDDDHVLARYATGSVPSQQMRRPADIWEADPIYEGAPCPEATLLHAGLHRWKDLKEDQTLFSQYLRVKVALFRHLRSDPAEAGLPNFVRVYKRISAYKTDLDGASLAIAADEPELDLGALELRTAPDPRADDLLDLFAPRDRTERAHAPEHRPTRTLEWGWTLHFLRHSHQDRDNNQGVECRFHRRYRDHLARASSIERVLAQYPQLLHVLRALDLADDETSGPLWLVLPSLQRLRKLSDTLAARHRGLVPLQLTLHAGEDFGHLLTGLRAVHEPFAWGLMRAGDRLGHAIALGRDAVAWAASGSPVQMKRWDRLMDLLWLSEGCVRFGVPRSVADRDRANREILSLASDIWGDAALADALEAGAGIDTLKALYRAMGDEQTLARVGLESPGPTTPTSRPEDGLLQAALYSPSVARRAFDENVPVSRTLDAELLAPLQTALRRHVARARVCVELNPSSNLLVAQLEGLVDEPAYRLRPTDPARADLVPVSLSADDPLSFSTRLSDEYAYAWAGMVVSGHVGPRYASDWLDEAARTSWRFRFTLPQSKDLDDIEPPGFGDRHWAHPPRPRA